MRIIKEEIIKMEEKGSINYDLPVDIYEISDIKTIEDARDARLPINYIYINGEDGVKIFKKDQDVLASLKDPTIRFKKLIKFDDYYNENNFYDKKNVLDINKIKYAKMFNTNLFDFPIAVINGFMQTRIFEFEFNNKRRIFLTDEELFSISKIQGLLYQMGYYKFISLRDYNNEGKRIWFLIDTPFYSTDNDFMLCPLENKYFNEFNGYRFNEELGHFKYPAKKYTNVEEKKQTILSLDLRPSDINKISQALFTIANYNDKKVSDEQSKADEKFNIEKMSNDLKLHTSIIIDYYENCLTMKQLKEKYDVSSYVIDRAIMLRYNDLMKFDVSIIKRKRRLSIREKRLLEIYDMISEEDKKIIIDLMDRQLAENITNVWHKKYAEELGYPGNINKKYNLGYSSFPYYYDSDVLYSVIYKKVKQYNSKENNRPHKLSNLILQVMK